MHGLLPTFKNWQHNNEQVISMAHDKYAVSGTSVRSLFAAYLMSQSSKRTVIFTAITLEDMATIARDLGHPVEAIAIDADTQQPNVQELKQVLMNHPDSIVVFTPLFGAIVQYQEAIQACRAVGAIVAIDNAQGFRGLEHVDYEDYDIMFWSFGPIKTMTSLAGGIALLSNNNQTQVLRDTVASFPNSSSVAFRKRILKYIILGTLSKPRGFSLLLAILALLHIDQNKVIGGSTRGYSADKSLLEQVRKRPNVVQQHLFHLQLANYPIDSIPNRTTYGNRARSTLLAKNFFGSQNSIHSFWLTPYIVKNPDATLQLLKHHGFHASKQTSALKVINPKKHVALQKTFQQVVYLPVDPAMTIEDCDRMIKVLQ